MNATVKNLRFIRLLLYAVKYHSKFAMARLLAQKKTGFNQVPVHLANFSFNIKQMKKKTLTTYPDKIISWQSFLSSFAQVFK